jgi:isochorismate hydrolase
LGDSLIKEEIKKAARTYWIVAGIESHVCILQTVRDLLKNGYTPVVVQDAISSRNQLDHTSALQEMRALGARITTTETLLFELMQDAKHPHFKAISALIK